MELDRGLWEPRINGLPDGWDKAPFDNSLKATVLGMIDLYTEELERLSRMTVGSYEWDRLSGRIETIRSDIAKEVDRGRLIEHFLDWLDSNDHEYLIAEYEEPGWRGKLLHASAKAVMAEYLEKHP